MSESTTQGIVRDATTDGGLTRLTIDVLTKDVLHLLTWEPHEGALIVRLVWEEQG